MLHVRSHLLGWFAGGLVLAVSGWATAQQTTEVRTETRTTAGTVTEVRKITTVIGSTVRLQEAAQYGKIEDIVLNDAGCVEYIVVSHESGYVLVPWTVAQVNYEERVVTIDTTPQRLETLVFTRDNWPNLSDPQFSRRVQQVFGAAVRRDGRGAVGIRGREVQEDRPVRAQGTEREGDDAAPDDRRPRARDATPKASGRPAPDDQPGGRDASPKAAARRPMPDAQPGGQDATPKAAGRRPVPGNQPGGREATPKAAGRRPVPSGQPEGPDTPKRPEDPPSEPKQP